MNKIGIARLVAATFMSISPGYGAQLAPDLAERLERLEDRDQTVDAVLQMRSGAATSSLSRLGLGPRLNRSFDALGMVSVSLTAGEARQLASDPRVLAISADAPVSAAGFQQTSLIQQVSAADVARSQLAVTGAGVAIAVLDSGVYPHTDLPITTSVNEVPISATSSDLFGHGTLVAGLALGTGAQSKYDHRNYSGIANGAQLIDVKVLGDLGTGQASWVLAGINWVLQNRTKYNIRVVNMSLGMPALQSYKTDPLCQATKLLHDAGIVTVVAAGNYGKGPNGSVAYGSITSPGNSPWVITVGAVNDHGTAARSDDTVSNYSSRGPTRSYDAVSSQFDNLLKPDLVATGNHVIGPEAANNWIAINFPSFVISSLDHGNYMYLNGTSMAAPIVSGAAALMLQANPALTPAQAKAILMYTSTTLPGSSMFDQGAGEVNAEGAVRLAMALKGAPLSGGPGTVLLAPARMPTPSSTIAGTSTPWSRGSILLQTNSSAGLVKAGGVLFAEGVIFAEGIMVAKGLSFAECTVGSEAVIYADRSVLLSRGAITIGQTPPMTSSGYVNVSGAQFAEAGTLGSGRVLSGKGVIFADGVLFAEGVIFAERKLSTAPVTFVGQSALKAEQYFAQGVLTVTSDLTGLFTTVNTVLVAGEAFIYL